MVDVTVIDPVLVVDVLRVQNIQPSSQFSILALALDAADPDAQECAQYVLQCDSSGHDFRW